MIFYLVRELNDYWVITNIKGDVVSGPKYFKRKDKAVEWAENFVSSFRGAHIKVGRK